MRILLFGGTGFIGQHAAKRWEEEGHEVIVLSRRHTNAPHGKVVLYEIDEMEQLFNSIKDEYAIINLAGESLNSGRWTVERKKRILDSRTILTGAIAQALDKAENKPKVWINASAIGYYGYSETGIFDEKSESGKGFLAETCLKWELATAPAIRHTRVVRLRLGIVLGDDGGALQKMIMPYQFYVGGKVGNGYQWVSWIHIDDVVGIISLCLIDETIKGPVNATNPTPVTMDDFGKAIGFAYRKPHWLPLPGFILKLIFGEMSDLLLQGQRVIPERMKQAGYNFRFRNLVIALKQIKYAQNSLKK